MCTTQNSGNRLRRHAFYLACIEIGVISILVSALSGCGIGASASSSTTSTNPGILSASSNTVDFGTVQLGSTTKQTITLTNAGPSALSVSSITITGAGFSLSGVNAPVVLSPSQAVSFSLIFAPKTAGVVTGTVTVSTDSSGTVAISLTGIGQSTASAHLSASPSSVNFGTVAVGSSNSQSVTLGNSGTASVTVSSASFAGPGFSVVGITTPVIFQPGQTSQFSVGFNPSSVGAATGSILLKDSGGATLLTVPMSGTAVAAVSHSVDLSWNPSSSAVSGYRVYRGTASGGPYSLLTPSLVQTTSFQDTTVLSGKSYFYVVTAVSAGNVESSYSNEVAVNIPTP